MGPDFMRAAMEDTASRLTRCYNRLWESEKWPEGWRKGAYGQDIQERLYDENESG